MIILASTSAARQRLLRNAGVVFTARAPRCDEAAVKQAHPHLAPVELAKTLARLKAESLRPREPAALIIGCDQVLSCDGRIFDKPRDKEEAHEHLRFLQGKTHTLHTATICLEPAQPPREFVSEPNLTMIAMTDPRIRHYLEEAGSAILSCVGCYQIEGLGVRLFHDITGDIFSIQGLPLLPLLGYLRASGRIT